MSDKVLVAVPGLGVLALEPETYRRALADGAQLAGSAAAPLPADEPLLDAEQLALALDIPRTWIEQRAREGNIPPLRRGAGGASGARLLSGHSPATAAPREIPTPHNRSRPGGGLSFSSTASNQRQPNGYTVRSSAATLPSG